MSGLKIRQDRPDNLVTKLYEKVVKREVFRVEKHIYIALTEYCNMGLRLSACLTTGDLRSFDSGQVVVCVDANFVHSDEVK